MKMPRALWKFLPGALLAASLVVAGADAASAQTVTTNFSVHNTFGATISLSSASCSPSTSIFPPASIANNGTGTFSASISGSTLLCTVRYFNGSDGCQFAVQVDVIGGSTTGFVQANAYMGSGGRPSCTGSGVTGVNQETGTFTMH